MALKVGSIVLNGSLLDAEHIACETLAQVGTFRVLVTAISVVAGVLAVNCAQAVLSRLCREGPEAHLANAVVTNDAAVPRGLALLEEALLD